MKKVYKAHPLAIFSTVKPFLLIFILPVVKAAIQYVIKGRVTDVLGIEIAFFLLVTVLAIIKWLYFTLIIENDTITVKSGFFLRQTAQIKFSHLSSVQVKRNPLDWVCGAVTYRINTEAGSRRKSDFEFKLSMKSSKDIYNLIYKDVDVIQVEYSPIKVAVMAATTSSATMGLLIGVPIINRAGDLLGVALNEMLFDEINNVSSKVETYFPPIVNTITLVFLLSYIVSFVYTLMKYMNFKLLFGKNSLEVRTGVFVRTSTVFKKNSINNVKIEQTPLMHLFKRFAMKVSVGGFGEKKAVSQVIMPSGKWSETKEELYKYFPFLAARGKGISSKRTNDTRNRFLFWPLVYLIITLTLSSVLMLKFFEFAKLILFLTIVIMFVIFYYAYINLHVYRYGKLSLGENVYARSTKRLNTYSLYCPRENVGQIRITRFGLDFKKNTCSVKLTVCSEGADSTYMRFLEYDELVNEIETSFNIKV